MGSATNQYVGIGAVDLREERLNFNPKGSGAKRPGTGAAPAERLRRVSAMAERVSAKLKSTHARRRSLT
jgi:hypothetical protein